MLIVHPLRPMDPRTRLRDTIKDKRTYAPANERIDLNRTIKEHKVLIIEGSRSRAELVMKLMNIDTDWTSFSENTGWPRTRFGHQSLFATTIHLLSMKKFKIAIKH